MAKVQLTQNCLRRLHKDYKELLNDPIPNMKIYISPDHLLKWYYCIYNLDDERYRGGEYYGLVELNHDYPLKAPSYYVYTPNGRFVIDKPICTTNSAFHPRDWQPTWTMSAILRGFLSLFLEDNEHAHVDHNHMKTSKAEKQSYAKTSSSNN